MHEDDIDALIARVNAGEAGARDTLFATAYPALRELASARLRDSGGHAGGLQTTQLVHESYLRLARSARLRPENRREFFAYAARVMREFIVETLRRPRVGEALTLDTRAELDLPSDAGEVLRVHEALAALQAAEPRLAQVVEMRYFGGYTETEIGEALGLTERTVRRDWEKARLLLLALLR
ncbi:RNA polymerase sigma factor (TIGR02999 family) [Pelomonas saccharophila]|uniref:RNA polymerase sigma factor (TIGR02999 family) n=1 Tax=Roseateles saccharophilus TaxID=304 RepID=A0ABU1YK78_ROSSA|nr:ECF-type sigma factor [Roseateles saccharophilus]MDR7269265.1 RNA polymerase sigma factor (TIGR02999 family) [Roseateles saccharophilus]